MIIHIKNMVCARCTMLVKNILDDLHMDYSYVEIGVVTLKQPAIGAERELFKAILKKWGLDLIEDSREILVEKIKHSIIKMIHTDEVAYPGKISLYLSSYLNYNYTYLANVFSEQTGISLRNFIIAHRIEKVKEMLTFEHLTVSEIAWKLNYSSVAHLSNQFSKITGISPSQFRKNA